MKKLAIAVVLIVAGITGQADAADPITPDTTIFTVVEHIDGNRLTLRMLHSVMSRNAETILFVGDEVRATLEPLLPSRTRRGLCVTAILGREGVGRIIQGNELSVSSTYPGCLARVHDFRGAAGLRVDQIAIDTVTTIMLNGDLVMDGPGGAPLPPSYCSYDVDFLNKTWQPFKHLVDGKARNICESDGPPRRMERVTCRLENLQGTQWVFIAHDRVIQASACEPGQSDPK